MTPYSLFNTYHFIELITSTFHDAQYFFEGFLTIALRWSVQALDLFSTEILFNEQLFHQIVDIFYFQALLWVKYSFFFLSNQRWEVLQL